MCSVGWTSWSNWVGELCIDWGEILCMFHIFTQRSKITFVADFESFRQKLAVKASDPIWMVQERKLQEHYLRCKYSHVKVLFKRSHNRLQHFEVYISFDPIAGPIQAVHGSEQEHGEHHGGALRGSTRWHPQDPHPELKVHGMDCRTGDARSHARWKGEEQLTGNENVSLGDKRMEDEGMAIVCLYIENRQKNVRMLGRCCGLTGPDGMSNRDSSLFWPFSPRIYLDHTEDGD